MNEKKLFRIGEVTLHTYLDLEYAIRKLEENQKESMVFLGKVGVGIPKEKLEKRDVGNYQLTFLVLDEEDCYEGQTEELEVEINPNKPEEGTRKVVFSREIFVEKEDFMIEPVKKYFRLFPGNEVRLKSAYFVKCVGYDTDENGEVTAVHCTYDPETRGGDSPDGRKVKGTLHWVSAQDCRECEVRLYDRLFNNPNPSDESTGSFKDNLNPDSLQILSGCLVEGSIRNSKPGDVFQFMRQGYFCVDTKSTDEKLIFNRTVALNSSFK